MSGIQASDPAPFNARSNPDSVLAEVEALGARIGRARTEIGRVIHGQREVIDQVLITLLSGGAGPGAEARAVHAGLDARRYHRQRSAR